MVWSVVMWDGVVWYGVVWYDVWCGIVSGPKSAILLQHSRDDHELTGLIRWEHYGNTG